MREVWSYAVGNRRVVLGKRPGMWSYVVGNRMDFPKGWVEVAGLEVVSTSGDSLRMYLGLPGWFVDSHPELLQGLVKQFVEMDWDDAIKKYPGVFLGSGSLVKEFELSDE